VAPLGAPPRPLDASGGRKSPENPARRAPVAASAGQFTPLAALESNVGAWPELNLLSWRNLSPRSWFEASKLRLPGKEGEPAGTTLRERIVVLDFRKDSFRLGVFV
jgi:hypothetical protein